VKEFCVRRNQRYLGSIPIDTMIGHAADIGEYVTNDSVKKVCDALLDTLPPDEEDY
jgi:hypothetical protein